MKVGAGALFAATLLAGLAYQFPGTQHVLEPVAGIAFAGGFVCICMFGFGGV